MSKTPSKLTKKDLKQRPPAIPSYIPIGTPTSLCVGISWRIIF